MAETIVSETSLRSAHVRKMPQHRATIEPLNRCLAVTDKGKDAWHKRTIGLAGVSQESVCRELSRVALAAEVGLEYRLSVILCVKA
ncbi:hypothetical protein ACQR1I_03445 [Bradyrhizobium sp. HKCCYLS2038]|uniref:hypothetical protein n=1 Tax=unclassified Bradyrhizobium TaxID=2631580 RepID=UPI003EB88B24